jgi:hypothetical protein
MSPRSSIYILNGNACVVEGDGNFLPFASVPENILSGLSSDASPAEYSVKGKSEFVTTSRLYFGSAEGDWKVVMITPAGDVTKDWLT